MISGNTAGIRNVRHLSLQYFYVRALSTSGKIIMKLIPSAANPSDMLTKVIHEELMRQLLKILKVVEY